MSIFTRKASIGFVYRDDGYRVTSDEYFPFPTSDAGMDYSVESNTLSMRRKRCRVAPAHLWRFCLRGSYQLVHPLPLVRDTLLPEICALLLLRVLLPYTTFLVNRGISNASVKSSELTLVRTQASGKTESR